MNSQLKIGVAFLFVLLIGASIGYLSANYTPLPPVSTDEQLNDIINISQKDAFCKANGYDYSAILATCCGEGWYRDANNLKTEYLITDSFQCRKIIPQRETATEYSYTQYKRWLLAIQFGGKP